MKTRNNVRKAGKKSLAIITGLILISLTIHAQDIWKSISENETFNVITIAMINGSNPSNLTMNKSTNVNSVPGYIMEEKEEELKLEDWMLDDTNFTISKESVEKYSKNKSTDMASFISIPEKEAELKLEKWMLDAGIFGLQPKNGKNNTISGSHSSLQDSKY